MGNYKKKIGTHDLKLLTSTGIMLTKQKVHSPSD